MRASTLLSITLAFALVATAAFAAGESDSDDSAAAEQEMVLDPSTGEMVKAPQYGGQLVIGDIYGGREPPHPDTWWGGTYRTVVEPVLEKLGMVDWAIDRDVWAFGSYLNRLDIAAPHLAESYETPDPLTIIFHIRPGVHWHDKAPMNGREFTADDVVFNFHRYTGTGSGFTEATTFGSAIAAYDYESITAPDKYTVVIKFNTPTFFALDNLYFDSPESGSMYPPEVIKEHGNAQDWTTLVGTGPFMMTDWVEGSNITYVKNPDYWKDDEKFPGNRLPYVDEYKLLFIKERATLLSALRTGQIAYMRDLSEQEFEDLQRTSPDLKVQTGFQFRSTTSYGMNVMKAPFDDVRVRKAMQLAIDLGTLNNALFGGLGDMTPRGILGGDTVGYHVPYEEWSDQLKADYGYDPERAEKLLDEAGYPRGADGVRFTTQLQYTSASSGNLDWTQAAKDYWAQIGVDVEIDIQEIAVFISNINGRTWEGMSWGEYAANSNGLYYARTHGHSAGNWNFSAAAYPEIDALIEAAESASTFEEMQRLVREWDMYAIENHWGVYGGVGPAWVVWQPWLGGYNGELQLGAAAHYAIPARIWIDQELKESMGH